MIRDSKSFFSEINVARGILVTLVVLGHIVSQVAENIGGVGRLISVIIYSFHMHAFFFVSGFVCLKITQFSTFRDRLNYTKKRALRLLVPYLVMGIIYLPLRFFSSSIARNNYEISDIWKILIGINPDGALWFLYVLFVTSMFVCFFVKFERIKLAIIFSFIISISTDLIHYDLAISRLFEFPVYFLLGIIVRSYYDKLRDIFSKAKFAIVSFIIFTIYNVLTFENEIICLRFITAFCGIFCLMNISILISKSLIFNKLGDYSMDIYIFSEPVKVVVRTIMKNTNLLLNLSTQFIFAMFVPIAISFFFVRRVKVLRRIFLGID